MFLKKRFQSFVEKHKLVIPIAWLIVAALVVVAKHQAPNHKKETSFIAEQNIIVAVPINSLERVIDGDTIIADGQRFRLAGIDSPELSEKKGDEARLFLFALLDEKRLSAAIEGSDHYGRLIADIYIDGLSVSELMLENGYARVFLTGDIKRNAVYKQLEDKAKKNKLGIWADESGI